MDEQVDPDVPSTPRRSVLEFVETHWRELTLRDARSLTVDFLMTSSAAGSQVQAPDSE